MDVYYRIGTKAGVVAAGWQGKLSPIWEAALPRFKKVLGLRIDIERWV
jgi:hypothetical protein